METKALREKEAPMFQIFYEEKLITILMFSLLLCSIIGRVIIGILYQNMIKEADNMSATKNKALKQCKMKFANCYQLNNRVSNIPIFVDKFINRLKVGPFSYLTVYHLSGQLMLLAVVMAGVGICKSILIGRSIGDILPFYIVSFLGLYLYFAVSAMADIKGRRRILKINLVDYLENHMVSRLAEGNLQEDESAKGTHRESRGKIELMPMHKEPEEPGKEEEKRIFSRSEEKELEELLKEFLTS